MKTKIWRSFSEVKGAGFFIWEVNECDGVTEEDVKRFPHMYLPTLDGGYILQPYCYHVWAEDKLSDLFWNNSDHKYFEVVPIVDGPVLF